MNVSIPDGGKIGLVVGAPGSMKQISMLSRDDVEILVAGETREWETVEYVRDASALGLKKAMILLSITTALWFALLVAANVIDANP